MRLTFTALLLAISPTLAAADTIDVGSSQRSYILDRATGNKPGPLIVGLHGGGGSATQFRTDSGLTPLANAAGVSVVYPESVTRQWNDGRARKNSRVDKTDDLGFLKALVQDLVAKGVADPQRIIFTGVSNGGMLSYAMACNTDLSIYAVAPVSANVDQGMDCSHTRVRLLNIVGTADRIVPMQGGAVLFGFGQGAVESSSTSFTMFLKASDCKKTVAHALRDTANDGMTSNITLGDGCERSPVAQIVVEGGGHSWPGGLQAYGRKLGVATQDFAASKLVVDLALGKTDF